MNIKLTPYYHHSHPDDPLPSEREKAEFDRLVHQLMELGYAQKLIHFTDGSVLIEKTELKNGLRR